MTQQNLILFVLVIGLVAISECRPRKARESQGYPIVAGPRPFPDSTEQLFNETSYNDTVTPQPQTTDAFAQVGVLPFVNTTAMPNATDYDTQYYNSQYYGGNDTEDDYYDYYGQEVNGTTAPVVVNGTMFNTTELEDEQTLKVHYGQNPNKRGTKNFVPLPLTESEAIVQQWTLDSDACPDVDLVNNMTVEPATYWRGRRYRLNGDIGLSLIYDYQGALAGIQSAFTPANPVVYPDSLVYRNIFNTEGAQRVATVYFKKPWGICGPVNETDGAVQEEFLGERLGDQLFIQTGSDPINQYAHIHKSEEELVSKSMWKPGSCLNGLGRHYWFNVSAETQCNTFVPVFLLYNEGQLSGFGWAFRADNAQATYASPRYEKLEPQITQSFFQQNLPGCLQDKQLATMHFFFQPSPWENMCPVS